jgi:1-acyl-sn-glycerol-3-phosphate acyltransferase
VTVSDEATVLRTANGRGPAAARGGAERAWPLLRLTVAPVLARLAPAAGYGVDRMPPGGGLVVAANHLSAVDHPLVGGYSARPLNFVSKAELLEIPGFGPLLARLGVFPVRRGSPDRDALRYAVDVARSGRVVAIHVEGTRQRFGHPGEVKAGAMLIALRAGVPVLPCGLDTFGWTPTNRRPCAVVWGEPIRLDGIAPTARGAREAAGIVGAEIVRLWRQAAEAVAAGLPPRLPDGAVRTRLRAPDWSPRPDLRGATFIRAGQG